MITIDFEIEGIAPILFDRNHGLPDPKTTEGYKKQSIYKLYLDDEENICIPSKNIKAVIREASSDLGGKMKGKKNRQTIRSALFFDQELYSTGFKEPDGIQEDYVSRGKGEKVTRVITFRPYVNEGWKVSGEIIVFDIVIGFVRECLEWAGFRYGLGGYRPEYGRFVVNKFEEIKAN